MTLWFIIMWMVIFLLGISVVYLSVKIPQLLKSGTKTKKGKLKRFGIGLCVVMGFMGIMSHQIDLINAAVCILYLAMIWAVSDMLFWILKKVFHRSFKRYYAGWIAIVLTSLALGAGWYLNHYVALTHYELTTQKDVPALKIAMIADVHLGTTFNAEKFARHLRKIQKQNPDIVVVVGDYVDDDTKKGEMIRASFSLGRMKTKYGVYFVLGNHDKGYYAAKRRGFSKQELIDTLKQNGVHVLQDETVLVADSFYIVGRRDFSETKERHKRRKKMTDLVESLDRNKYIIVLDHQPADFENQAAAKVDLVLSGHTHGGQLFPFNQVGKWIGANDFIYGHERRDDTDFIVTSGISSWAIKFKTGTKSEFVIMDIKGK